MALLPTQHDGGHTLLDDLSRSSVQSRTTASPRPQPSASPRVASETSFTDHVDVSDMSTPTGTTIRNGVTFAASGAYSLTASAMRFVTAALAEHTEDAPQLSSDLSGLRQRMRSRVAEHFGESSGRVRQFDGVMDALMDFEPQMYQTLLLLMKMMAEDDPEGAMRMVESAKSMMMAMRGLHGQSGTMSHASLRITQVNFEASLTAQTMAARGGPTPQREGTWTIRVGEERIRIELTAEREAEQGDPLVLDLEGDGIHLRNADAGVEFDLTGSGETVRTAFVQGDDALLFLDANDNGIADNGKELFGDQDGHAHGFAELMTHDENEDGRIDAQDSIYGQLRLFQDRNGDGRNQLDETLTLAEAGVKSIFLDYADINEEDGQGNRFSQKAGFVRTDGLVSTVADAWLRFYR